METQIPTSLPPPAPAGRQGCARNALLGCGVVALLLLAIVVGLFLYARRNPTFLTDLMMRQVESHYAPDVTEQDKSDLRAAYADFRTALKEKRVSRGSAQRLQLTLSGSRSSQLDREQVHALTRAFREAASQGRSEPSSAVSPLPSATPSP